jgi:hypothetical protein
MISILVCRSCAGTNEANLNLPIAEIMAAEAVKDQKCMIASSDLCETDIVSAEAHSATTQTLRNGEGLWPRADYFVRRLMIRAQLLIPR